MSTPPMTCDLLDEMLPDVLEASLNAADALAVREHTAACERCAALIRDLTALRERAAALPLLHPSRDLWPSIAERIAAPVVALAPAGAPARRLGWSTPRLAAAAAALVVLSAGVTYQVTRQFGRDGSGTVAVNPGPAPVTAPPVAAPQVAAPQVAAADPDSLIPLGPRPVDRPAHGTPAALSASQPGATLVARRPAEATFQREVAALRRILDARRASLDPATLDILERNMRVIDAAIAESRAALARDPASAFLDQQLNSALDKKLELMRTTALLPSRT